MSSPTKTSRPPKGGDLKTLRYSDFPAGQKKKTRVTATWGSTSRYGSQRLRKTVRFTRASPGRLGLLVAANSFSSAFDFATASSRPCFAVFFPPKMFSSSLSMASRICTKLPSRSPWLFARGHPLGLRQARPSCRAWRRAASAADP